MYCSVPVDRYSCGNIVHVFVHVESTHIVYIIIHGMSVMGCISGSIEYLSN